MNFSIFLALCGDSELIGGVCWGVVLVVRVLVCDVSCNVGGIDDEITTSMGVTSMLINSSEGKSVVMGMLLLLSGTILILLLLNPWHPKQLSALCTEE